MSITKMDFRTRIEIPPSLFPISHKDKILMIGSCFTENIGTILAQNKFNINLNPFGILYNPESIYQALKILIEKKQFRDEDIFQFNGLYHSFYHHSRFSDRDKEKCLQNINAGIQEASHDLRNANILFITFGTSYIYRFVESGMIVGNCHKLPATQFDRSRLNTDQIVEVWNGLISDIKSINPKLKIIFTVSPIRHLKDGAHENQLSKSTLLLAVNELCSTNNATYFPSYEIVLDELRDYRFYNEDMIHPNNVAIKYIWNRFGETYFSSATIQIMQEWAKIQAAIEHRPFNTDGDEYKRFLGQTLLKLETFSSKYPYICCSSEKIILEDRIKK